MKPVNFHLINHSSRNLFSIYTLCLCAREATSKSSIVGCLWHSTSKKYWLYLKISSLSERKKGNCLCYGTLSCWCRKTAVFPAYNHKIWIFINISRTIKLSFYFSWLFSLETSGRRGRKSPAKSITICRCRWWKLPEIVLARNCLNFKQFKRHPLAENINRN